MSTSHMKGPNLDGGPSSSTVIPVLTSRFEGEGRVTKSEPPEFTESRVRFVPLRVQSCNNNKVEVVPWPAMMFENSEIFRRELQSRGLLKNPSKELELHKIQRRLREMDLNPPFVYLFGNPPVQQRVIPLNRCNLHQQQTWHKVCPYMDIPEYWSAYTELQFALRPSSPTLDDGIVESFMKPTRKRRPSLRHRVLANIANKRTKPLRVPMNKRRRRKKQPVKVDKAIHESVTPPPKFDYWGIECIPSFEEVKATLENEGYKFDDGKYCLPEGACCFDSERDFREHLCSSGIPLKRGKSSRRRGAKYESLIAWVSYHRVAKMLDDIKGEKPSITGTPRLHIRTARVLKEKVGLRVGGNGRWVFPGRDSCLEQSDMCNELSKNGLPQGCDVTVLSQEELLSLELYIGAPTFRRMSFFVTSTRNSVKRYLGDELARARGEWKE